MLLIGIVKKNAIMMIDFALQAERNEGKSTADAIFEACMLRFRPIMMTTMAALFGALAAGVWHRHRFRASPAAWHHHRGRADYEPVADAVHHAGRLPDLRSIEIAFPGKAARHVPRRGRTDSGDGLIAGTERSNTMIQARILNRFSRCPITPDRRHSHFSGGVPTRTRFTIFQTTATAFITTISLCAMTGCMVGPPYKPPHALMQATPGSYKESPNQFPDQSGWKVAQPQDAMLRGKWWEIFHEPDLNVLEDQLNINNQNIKEFFQNYMEARC